MTHIGIERRGVFPEPNPLAPRIPEGYERGDPGNPLIQLVCQTCFASVVDDAAERHTAWHSNS